MLRLGQRQSKKPSEKNTCIYISVMAVQNSFIDLIAINSFIHLNAIFFTFAVTRQSENSKYKYSFYGLGYAAML